MSHIVICMQENAYYMSVSIGIKCTCAYQPSPVLNSVEPFSVTSKVVVVSAAAAAAAASVSDVITTLVLDRSPRTVTW